MVPIFHYGEGIFWMGNTAAPWKQLGINILGTLAIFVWSAILSIALFGILKWFKLLRIDRDTEFRGCDLVKHGEHAYPADAWVELQYDIKKKNSAMGPMMRGTDQSKKSFNDAMEMVPTMGGLFQSISNNFDHFDGNSGQQNSNDIELGNGRTKKGIDNKAAVTD